MLKCEVVSKLLPSIRASVAKDLRKAGLTQEKIAEILGTSQGAVSQYLRKRRGKTVLDPNIKKLIKELTNALIHGSDFETEMCKLCKKFIQVG